MRIRILFSYFFLCISALSACQDAIHFFDVGQGHSTLVTRRGGHPDGKPFTPLLIDAGESAAPIQLGTSLFWEEPKNPQKVLVKQIADTIQKAWKRSNKTLEQAQKSYGLNIIITHPDLDHKNMIPDILKLLRRFAAGPPAIEMPISMVLGGRAEQYWEKGTALERQDWRWILDGRYPAIFSEAVVVPPLLFAHYQEGTYPPNLAFLQGSGCITDLFVPAFSREPNACSIVTRVQIPTGLSALITGDASNHPEEKERLQEYLCARATARDRLRSDILLYPHHGSHPLLPAFLTAVDPKTVVFSSRYSKYYRAPGARAGQDGHPTTSAVNSLRNATRLRGMKEGRLGFKGAVPHAIELGRGLSRLLPQDRLFPQHAPRAMVRNGEATELVMTTLPIYTTSTSGTMVFTTDPRNPQFPKLPLATKGGCSGLCTPPPPDLAAQRLAMMNPVCLDLIETQLFKIETAEKRIACRKFINEVSEMALQIPVRTPVAGGAGAAEDSEGEEESNLLKIVAENTTDPTWRWLREAFVAPAARAAGDQEPLLEAARDMFSSAGPSYFPKMRRWSCAERVLFLNIFAQLHSAAHPIFPQAKHYHTLYQYLKAAKLPIQDIITENVNLSHLHTWLTCLPLNEWYALRTSKYLKIWLEPVLALLCPMQQCAATHVLRWATPINPTFSAKKFKEYVVRALDIIQRAAEDNLQHIIDVETAWNVDEPKDSGLDTPHMLHILESMVKKPECFNATLSETIIRCKEIYQNLLKMSSESSVDLAALSRDILSYVIEEENKEHDMQALCSNIMEICESPYGKKCLQDDFINCSFEECWKPLCDQLKGLDEGTRRCVSQIISILPQDCKVQSPHQFIADLSNAECLEPLKEKISQYDSLNEYRAAFKKSVKKLSDLNAASILEALNQVLPDTLPITPADPSRRSKRG